MKLQDIRKNYSKDTLNEVDLNANPIQQFELWLSQALDSDQLEPTAMTLSTVKSDHSPTSRIVLLKGIDQGQFRFFTNYNSNKGHEISSNSNASLLFFWPSLERQIRIEGSISKTSGEVSDTYFKSRPIKSQAGAIASKQSEVLLDKQSLISDYMDLKEKKTLERPANWGGYQVDPHLIEFWQGGEHRLHDRFTYKKQEDNSWLIDRLYP